MLEIIAQPQPGTEQVLDLFEDTVLDVIWENPFFLTDRIPVAGTLSFNVPPTPKNLQVFNFPERVPVIGVHGSVPGRIRHSGIEILNGELLLIAFDQFIQLQFKGSLESLESKTEMNQVDMGDIDFGVEFPQTYNDLVYYNVLNGNGDPAWQTYCELAVERSTNPNPNPFCFAPVKTNVKQWDGNRSIRGVMNGFLQYVNFFRAKFPSFMFTENILKVHFPVIPFFALHKILSMAMGNTLGKNPFAAGDLAKIVVIAANHPNNVLDFVYEYNHSLNHEWIKPVSDIPQGQTPELHNVYWKYNRFQQQYKFVEFLKEILKAFGMTLFRGTKNNIEHDNDIFDRQVVVNWDDKLDGQPILRRLTPKDYILTFAPETPKIEGTVSEFNTWKALYQWARSANRFKDLNCRIQDDNHIVSVNQVKEGSYMFGTKADTIVKTEVVRTSLANDKEYQFEEQEIINPKVTPLDMNIELYWWFGRLTGPGNEPLEDNTLYKGHWHVPVMGDKKPQDPPHIMFFAGRKDTFGERAHLYPYEDLDIPRDEYPYLTNHHTDHYGNRIFDFSLQPDAPDGLQQTFHNKREAWTEKEKLELKAFFTLQAQDIKNLDMRDKFHVRGKNFFLQKIQFKLHHNHISSSDATLIEV